MNILKVNFINRFFEFVIYFFKICINFFFVYIVFVIILFICFVFCGILFINRMFLLFVIEDCVYFMFNYSLCVNLFI